MFNGRGAITTQAAVDIVNEVARVYGIPDRTPEADVISSQATTGDSNNELSVEACRFFRSALDTAQAHNPSEEEAFDGAALTAEQQQAVHDEENRTYHMLREHGARRLKKRMLPEDYAQFMLKVVKHRHYETMIRTCLGPINSRQLSNMERVFKKLGLPRAYNDI